MATGAWGRWPHWPIVRKQKGMRVNVPLTFSFMFILGHHPIRWCLPHSECIFLSQLNHLRLQDAPRDVSPWWLQIQLLTKKINHYKYQFCSFLNTDEYILMQGFPDTLCQSKCFWTRLSSPLDTGVFMTKVSFAWQVGCMCEQRALGT